ncbi:MAG: glutamate-5-semialdehyde dehydrogenase [Armatimonadota bacterium]|jgi:glutamate-5-semialdehyde dehydrogenase
MATETTREVVEKAKQAREVTTRLASMSRGEKDCVLLLMADAIGAQKGAILEANARDIENAQKRKLSAAPIDRLMLDDARVKEMADGLRDLARLSDPVGEIIEGWRLPNGLEISKVRIPLGVIGIIYESRPNVTVDAAGLCLKSGNATILRGGSDAINSNLALVKVMNDAAMPAGLPAGAIGIIESTDREAAAELMRLNEYIDVLIPRGGHELIRRVKRESTVPVIETGEGVCHVYLDASADLAKAEPIVVNAKCQRPSVCNSAETLLVHKDCAAKLLPPIGKKLGEMGVELRACERSIEYLEGAKPATEDDWATEYLSLILSVKMVDSLDEAIAHIKRYSTRNSDAIITEDLASARKFTQEVDSAAVYVNASTRFTDGGQFGLGAEIGISNQKLHARGPMGLRELTIYKYVIYGDGQIRA